MSAQIQFYAGLGLNPINNIGGSGLGFFGSSGFGASVAVNAWQGRTFITDGNGVNQGPESNNVMYLNAQSGVLGQAGSGINLTAMPNQQATVRITFTNDTAVKTQNVQLRIYDRSDPNKPASGVVTAVAELVHPDPTQSNNGSGSQTWQFPGGSGTIMSLTASPGTSGLRPNGPNTTDTEHDWYVSLSASPSSIGSKTQYGLYVYLEYL